MITVYGLSAFLPQLKGIVRDIRITWTLEELGMQYQHKIMDPTKREHKTAEYMKLNPFGKVPTITDGDFVLYESSAICTYLAEKAGKLIPASGTPQRAKLNQWVAFTTSTFEPLSARLFGFDFNTTDITETIKQQRADAVRRLDNFLSVVNAELGQRSYLVGDEFTIADIMFSCSCRFIQHAKLMDQFPKLSAYLEKNFQRPAFKRAFEGHAELA